MDVKLVMFKANGQRKDFPIINPTTVIGRGEDCDLRIPLLSVSRRHCQLSLADEKINIKDLASSNGTYINNERVNEHDLSAGDRLAVGPIIFTVQVGGIPEEIKPVKTKLQRMAEAGDVVAGEEAVDLEAEVVAQPGASALQSAAEATEEGSAGRPETPAAEQQSPGGASVKTPAAGPRQAGAASKTPAVKPAQQGDDFDPIAALEALSAETDEDEDSK